jgi:hypothetical protein
MVCMNTTLDPILVVGTDAVNTISLSRFRKSTESNYYFDHSTRSLSDFGGSRRGSGRRAQHFANMVQKMDECSENRG